MLFLQGHGVSSTYATRIYKTYGQEAIKIVGDNPYRLAQDIRGIGIKTADKIAQEMGIDPLSPFRAEAALEHTLSELADEGHVYSPAEELVAACVKEMDLPEELLLQAIDSLQVAGRIVRDGDAVYLRGYYVAERGVADSMKALLAKNSMIEPFNVHQVITLAQKKIGLTLTKTQEKAVGLAITEKVAVVTGGPGTGKTTILKAVLSIMETLGLQVVLAAPTGRAAKRLNEATGREAKTLHRLLDFRPGDGRFLQDQDNQLDADAVIVDETSMVDILLMYHLLKAVPRRVSLLLVGDVDQLPSVGPGNVLKDILDSGTVPSVLLEDIFRQAKRSQIIEQAHRINQGMMPRWSNERPTDFFVATTDDPERAAELIVQICKERIPHKFGLNPITDIQVLSPMNRGSTGATALNGLLQKALNPN
jgi:exodeoxyribonuclease V alpha subunit